MSTDSGKAADKLLRPLHVDVHDHVLAFREDPLDLRPERAVQVPVNLRRFRELARCLASPKSSPLT